MFKLSYEEWSGWQKNFSKKYIRSLKNVVTSYEHLPQKIIFFTLKIIKHYGKLTLYNRSNSCYHVVNRLRRLRLWRHYPYPLSNCDHRDSLQDHLRTQGAVGETTVLTLPLSSKRIKGRGMELFSPFLALLISIPLSLWGTICEASSCCYKSDTLFIRRSCTAAFADVEVYFRSEYIVFRYADNTFRPYWHWW